MLTLSQHIPSCIHQLNGSDLRQLRESLALLGMCLEGLEVRQPRQLHNDGYIDYNLLFNTSSAAA